MTHTYTHTLTPPQQAKQIHATYVAEDILLSRRTRQRQESDLVFESAYEGRLLSVSQHWLNLCRCSRYRACTPSRQMCQCPWEVPRFCS